MQMLNMKESNLQFHYYILVLLCLCLISCKKKEGAVQDNSEKIFRLENVGWKSKQVNRYINTINYTATEVPLQYYILKNQGNADLNKVDSIYKSNERERVLEIEFHHDEEKDLLLSEFTSRNYQEAVKYMAFTIKKDFTIVTSSKDTIPCAGVQFERNFKVAPFKRALLYFGNINPEDEIQLIYNDELFGNGIIKFKFKETPIKL